MNTDTPSERSTYVFFDISISDEAVGRVVVELFVDRAPQTCAHIIETLPQYEQTYFHRVIKNFMIKCGEVLNGQAKFYENGNEGVLPKELLIGDENLQYPMDQPFLLSMVKGSRGKSASQFFITTASAVHLQGKCSVFGRVVYGKSVVREIERVSTSSQGHPSKNELPKITNCGIWNEGDPVPIYNACYDTIGGDIYEEYPDDDESITIGSLLSVVHAASIIKDSGGALLKQGKYRDAYFKYRKSLRYVMEYIPDIYQDPECFKNFTELKKKLYLNLALVMLKLGDYQMSFDYGTYLLDMELFPQEKAKTLYRMGCASFEQKKYEDALKLFKSASELTSDASIERDVQKVESVLKKKKSAEKAKFSRMFG